jgi:cytoskeletal protein CcmA (bactofilin family)
MGVFNRDRTASKQKSSKPTALPTADRTNATTISAGTNIVGEIKLEGKLHIDGSVEGKIYSDGFISIGKDGHVVGEIRADAVIISGFFEGQIAGTSVEIMEGGKVIGEICSNELVIEPGGMFIGNSKMLEEAKSNLGEPTNEKAEEALKKSPKKDEKGGE